MRLWVKCLSLCVFSALLCSQLFASSDLASANAAYDKKDYATAYKVLAPLVKQGDPGAQVLLGTMYLRGYGVLKDPDEAYKLFQAAAAKGSADGEFFIGARSVLTHVDLKNGLQYLNLSAEQGNQDAQLLLGQNYLQGIPGFLPRDPVKADMWLRLAAKDNLPFYQAQLAGAERTMNPSAVAKAKDLAAAWKPQHGLKPDNTPKPAPKLEGSRRPHDR